MRTLRNYACALLVKVASARQDVQGATAVEFALILPIMVLLYMSTVEISQAISVQRKVAIVAGTLGDLTAQQETVNNDLLDLIFSSASVTILPYSAAPLIAHLTSVAVADDGSQTVKWSYSWDQAHSRTSYLATGTTYTLPADLQVPHTSVIVAEISYAYTSPIEFIFPTSRSLTSKTFFRPRLGTEIPFESSTPTPPTWPLGTTGPDGTQIGPNYIGFGAEYSMQVRPVNRFGSVERFPDELENAQRCYYNQPTCDPDQPGGTGDPGSNGGGGGGCYAMPPVWREFYMMPVQCGY